MVTELTEEKLTVLTKMGSFTYTKVKYHHKFVDLDYSRRSEYGYAGARI